MINALDLPKAPADTRVVVAMSGGVDSSVVAAMLARDGYDVVGITLQLYDHGAATARKASCCAGRDIHDARNVAAKLGIPHYVLDYETRFHERVIAPFAESYLAGETPIPCVSCNQHVKFADLFETARDLGADCLATGHYVASRAAEAGRALFRARDRDRDQSYFLYATTKAQLDFLRFPLGDLPKAQVRDLAREFDLPVADKPDSQDICFVPTGRYSDLIERLRPEAVNGGDIVHLDGRILGRHRGIINYTVGQRRGLGLAENNESGGEPLYVVKLEFAARARRGRSAERAGDGRRRAARNQLDRPWHARQRREAGAEIAVRLRSTKAPVPAVLALRDGVVSVRLASDQDGVSPGQACVFYDSTKDDARVLGGGIIQATVPASRALQEVSEAQDTAVA